MANRTGTYCAFDGLGETDPTSEAISHFLTNTYTF